MIRVSATCTPFPIYQLGSSALGPALPGCNCWLFVLFCNLVITGQPQAWEPPTISKEVWTGRTSAQTFILNSDLKGTGQWEVSFSSASRQHGQGSPCWAEEMYGQEVIAEIKCGRLCPRNTVGIWSFHEFCDRWMCGDGYWWATEQYWIGGDTRRHYPVTVLEPVLAVFIRDSMVSTCPPPLHFTIKIGLCALYYWTFLLNFCNCWRKKPVKHSLIWLSGECAVWMSEMLADWGELKGLLVTDKL